MDKYPFQLSGGMARRVLISTAAMEDAELVIADEPTPGLDKKTAMGVMDHFRQMADRGGRVCFSSPMIWSWRSGRRTG